MPVADGNDALFARVLGYGPAPLLAGDLTHKLMPPQILGGDFDPREYAKHNLLATDEPDPSQLAIDPELIRVIVPNQPEDSSGRDSMIELIPAQSGVHYLLPLPPGVAEDAPELFGFWTYEFRIGHKLWSLQQAFPGRPLRVSGVQHPAPTLACSAHRVVPTEGPAAVFEPPTHIVVTAPYATPVYADQKLTNPAEGDPRTRMWIMLYAQVMRADGSSWRNILLGRKFATPRFDRLQIEDRPRTSTRDVIGRAEFDRKAIEAVLTSLALPVNSPLSVLAVELLPSGGLRQDLYPLPLPFVDVDAAIAVTSDAAAPAPADPFAGAAAPFAGIAFRAAITDPLGVDLGTIRSHRILRASPLTPVPPAC